MVKLRKKERQQQLLDQLKDNPFITDEELSKLFRVSIQTIRLDRMELGIPELRERIKHVAERQFDLVKSLPLEEVIGEIIDLRLDERAISILDIKKEHVFSRTGIARGHHIFAQANSLAVAVINEEMALTASATIRFIRPVRLGERLVAKAEVKSIEGEKSKVKVDTFVREELVFTSTFMIHRANLDSGGNEEVKESENSD